MRTGDVGGLRVLVVTHAERNHFLGIVPLAWALQNAGHQVRVASQPALTDVVTTAGLTAVPVGRDHHFWRVARAHRRRGGAHALFPPLGLDGDATPEYLLGEYHRVVPWWWRLINDPMLDDLVASCRHWRPHLVIWGAVTFSGAIAAEACGAAHVRFLFGSDLFARLRSHFLAATARLPVDRRADPLADWLGSRAEAHGVTFSETLTTGQATIDYLPEALRVPTDEYAGQAPSYLPLRYVPYNGRGVVPAWLREPPPRPRVCLSLGTSTIERFGAYAVSVQDLLDALGDLDVDVVATLARSGQDRLHRVPGNTRVVAFVPLHALAPTCAVMINHGGGGTVCTAIDAGVPQLGIPAEFDEPVLCARLAAAGAGVSLSVEQASPAAVRDRTVALLTDTAYRASALRLREQMRSMPTPIDVAGQLTDLVAARR